MRKKHHEPVSDVTDAESSATHESEGATPIAATLQDLVHEFDLSNKDGRKSLEGDASYAP